MDENEGAGSWLRYYNGNGDLRCENGGFEAGAAMAAA